MKLGITVDNFNCFGKDRFKKMKEYGVDFITTNILE